MAKEVKWTKRAVISFDKITEYLEKDWTEKEVQNFVQATNRTIRYISINPKMFRKTNKKDIHEALISSHNL